MSFWVIRGLDWKSQIYSNFCSLLTSVTFVGIFRVVLIMSLLLTVKILKFLATLNLQLERSLRPDLHLFKWVSVCISPFCTKTLASISANYHSPKRVNERQREMEHATHSSVCPRMTGLTDVLSRTIAVLINFQPGNPTACVCVSTLFQIYYLPKPF